MSVPNINNSDVPSVNPTDALTNEQLTKQYREQYQQLYSQYETALAERDTVSSDIRTYVGETVCLAIDNRLTDAKIKLDALKTAVEASEPEADNLKTMTNELKALLSKLTADITAVPTLATDGADIAALREIWAGLSDADKALLGSEFTQTIEARFSALNAKIIELKKAIENGADASSVEKLQSEISELKTQLNTLINGTADGLVVSLTDRIDCLKSLEEAKRNMYVSDEQYATFRQQLLQTDISKQISKEDFQMQLDALAFPEVQKKIMEDAETNKAISKHATAVNELLKNNVALKVMQEKNSFLEFKLNAEADAKLQEKAEFNPQVKQLRDEGRWQTPEMTRQREVTQMQNEDERRREATAQVR